VKDAQGNTTKTVETTKNDDGKTLWDWLSLLGVPASLAILGYILQQLQQKRAEELAKEEVLQVYFDRLSMLLVDKNLLAIAAKKDRADEALVKKDEADEEQELKAINEEQELLASAMDVIRARTLSILRRFEKDPERKISVIRFLIEADIVSKLRLNLSGVDLSNADLSSEDLNGVDFHMANLSGANFYGANLSGANLIGANLTSALLWSADLSRANLTLANLSNADLSEANLSKAFLIKTNLTGATNLTVKQLLETEIRINIKLPKGIPSLPDKTVLS
jgi:uncharacterized protein YjbI with pentapeptide repeats